MITSEEIKSTQKKATKDFIIQALLWSGLSVAAFLLGVILKIPIGGFIIRNPPVYCLAIWIVFVCLSSSFEALYYTHEIHSSFKDNVNEHVMLTIMRACVALPLFLLSDWQTLVCIIFISPFFHDGQYYTYRNKLVTTLYPKTWFDQSTTSSAWSTKYFPPVVRCVCLVIGISVLIYFEWIRK